MAYLSLRNYNYSIAQRNGAGTMIDHLDKQTQSLPLEQKRGRGRPATGQALSNAERQRAYRERQKAQRNEKSNSEDVERLTKNFRQVHGEMERLRVQAVEKDLKIAQLEKQIELLKAELKKKTQRNEKPEKAKEGRYVMQKKSPAGRWLKQCIFDSKREADRALAGVPVEMMHMYRIRALK